MVFLPRLTLVVALASILAAVGCSSSSSGGTSGGDAGGGGGGGGGGGDGTTLACVVALGAGTPQCQYYEASGKDAVTVIDQLRAGCVDQGGATAKVVDACPTDGLLGGCKTPVTVKGGAQVTLFVTNFDYVPAADAGILGGPKTTDEVKQQCTDQEGVFVASPP